MPQAVDRIEHLTRAFEQFSQKTAQLESAYSILKRKFAAVNLQLEEKVVELDETSQTLRSIVANMAQGLLFVEGDGTIRTLNPAAESILRCGNLVGRSFWDAFADDLFGFSLREALRSGKATTQTRVTLDQRQGFRYLDVTTSVALGEETTGVIVLMRDVTEVQHLQVLADRNDRMKDLGEMAAQVAHEIRNPLGGIGGFASLLVRDLEDRPHALGMAQQIVGGTKALNRLVTDILHYARPLQLMIKPEKLAGLLDEVCALAEADELVSQKVSIIRDYTGSELEIPCDREVLKGAVLNLIVNAAQATQKRGEVRILVAQEGDRVVISVEDNGRGIPVENREKIFSPFFTTRMDGNGFGLSEVHRVIQAHGGAIDVESEEGSGSTFFCRLPHPAGKEL